MRNWNGQIAFNLPIRKKLRALRIKRRSNDVHPVEHQLRFQRLANVRGLSKAVLLALKDEQAGRDIAALQRREHGSRLGERHDRVVLAVQKYDGGREFFYEIDGRAVMIERAATPIRLDQPVHIVQLELVRVDGQRGDVADT